VVGGTVDVVVVVDVDVVVVDVVVVLVVVVVVGGSVVVVEVVVVAGVPSPRPSRTNTAATIAMMPRATAVLMMTARFTMFVRAGSGGCCVETAMDQERSRPM
jgi:hypothetical protein